ncbi:CK1/CK1 protein kinase [Allomyces macrogynus ATCC 38327]|uniref:non-specific serine/threonine protein kinase n=1 Tax=Allomyces macrogynus (strain ATCC 38327) TaxID=578462 RepID=A0A0L0T3E3_ALLM3|nr:CK1/CK1 protein kinase [Allomyces macrogynus ATCC 38327]|eukprot:KNE69247.1 CK1/CK1 protein kinase [Allomyces macrogynus ATCC 38327]
MAEYLALLMERTSLTRQASAPASIAAGGRSPHAPSDPSVAAAGTAARVSSDPEVFMIGGGKWRVKHRIGAGAFGEVFEGEEIPGGGPQPRAPMQRSSASNTPVESRRRSYIAPLSSAARTQQRANSLRPALSSGSRSLAGGGSTSAPPRAVAIKRELKSRELKQMEREVQGLRQILAKCPADKQQYLPTLYTPTRLDEGLYWAMVISLHGHSLKVLKRALLEARNNASWETQHAPGGPNALGLDWSVVASVGIQLTYALSVIHDAGFVYRDMKPDNILLRTPCANLRNLGAAHVVLVDFGLLGTWRDPATGKHVSTSREEKPHRSGTAKYAAIAMHAGYPATRRCDLESLVYTLLELHLSHLPWSHIPTSGGGSRLWKATGTLKKNMTSADWEAADAPTPLVAVWDLAMALARDAPVPWDKVRSLLSGIPTWSHAPMPPVPPLWTGVSRAELERVERVISAHLSADPSEMPSGSVPNGLHSAGPSVTWNSGGAAATGETGSDPWAA